MPLLALPYKGVPYKTYLVYLPGEGERERERGRASVCSSHSTFIFFCPSVGKFKRPLSLLLVLTWIAVTSPQPHLALYSVSKFTFKITPKLIYIVNRYVFARFRWQVLSTVIQYVHQGRTDCEGYSDSGYSYNSLL